MIKYKLVRAKRKNFMKDKFPKLYVDSYLFAYITSLKSLFSLKGNKS